ncbi:MAG: hypothetical protein Q9159_007558 [Coniocarpon cinnabarinum]
MRLTGSGVSVELTVRTEIDVKYRAQVHGELKGVAGVKATPEELEGCGKAGTEDEDVGVDTIVLVTNATVELVSELEVRGNAGRDEDEGVGVGDGPFVVLGGLGKAGRLEDDGVGVGVAKILLLVLSSLLVSPASDEELPKTLEDIGEAGKDEVEGVNVGIGAIFVVELTAAFEEELESRGKGSWDDVNDGEDVTTVDEEALGETSESEEEEDCL